MFFLIKVYVFFPIINIYRQFFFKSGKELKLGLRIGLLSLLERVRGIQMSKDATV